MNTDKMNYETAEPNLTTDSSATLIDHFYSNSGILSLNDTKCIVKIEIDTLKAERWEKNYHRNKRILDKL